MAKLAALPGVSVFAGDLMVHADVAKALEGVSRAMLVSGAFSHDQFEVEAHFIEAAARANLEITVRVSTASGLIKPGTKGAYGRTHHGLAAFIEASKYRCVDLCPDWFLTNFNGNAGEAKATGKISLPVAGTGPAMTVLDPRDVGAAAAAILLQPTAGLAPFLAKRVIEVHGPSKVNFEAVVAVTAAGAKTATLAIISASCPRRAGKMPTAPTDGGTGEARSEAGAEEEEARRGATGDALRPRPKVR